MKSQEAAFRSARKPAKKPKEVIEVQRATPKKIQKNASRNERRKAARKVASLMKAQRGGQKEVVEKKDGEGEIEKMEVEKVVEV